MVISEFFFFTFFVILGCVQKGYGLTNHHGKWINDVQACPSQIIVDIKEQHNAEKKKTTLKNVVLKDEVTITNFLNVQSR